MKPTQQSCKWDLVDLPECSITATSVFPKTNAFELFLAFQLTGWTQSSGRTAETCPEGAKRLVKSQVLQNHHTSHFGVDEGTDECCGTRENIADV